MRNLNQSYLVNYIQNTDFRSGNHLPNRTAMAMAMEDEVEEVTEVAIEVATVVKEVVIIEVKIEGREVEGEVAVVMADEEVDARIEEVIGVEMTVELPVEERRGRSGMVLLGAGVAASSSRLHILHPFLCPPSLPPLCEVVRF